MRALCVRAFSAFVVIFAGIFIFGSGDVFAATVTWDGEGGDSNFSTAANWVGDVAPVDGDDLVFPFPPDQGGGDYYDTATNDSLTTIAGITVQGDATNEGTMTVAGNDFALFGDVSIGENVSLHIAASLNITADIDVTFTNKTSFSVSSAEAVELNDNQLNITYDGGFTGASTTNDLAYVYIENLTGTSASKFITTGVRQDLTSATADNTAFQGVVELNDSSLQIESQADLGTVDGGLIMNDSRLCVNIGAGTVQIDDSITIEGNLFGVSNTNGAIGQEALAVFCGTAGTKVDFAGSVTLNSDILLDPYYGHMEISGPFSGNYLLGVTGSYGDSSGNIIISSSNNTALIPNGNYRLIDQDTTINNDDPDADIIISRDRTLTINGTRGRIIMSPGSVLLGEGTVGDVSILLGAKINPGNSPGCLETGSLGFSDGGIYVVEIDSGTVCSGYDQSQVTGTVTLNNATLNVQKDSGYTPSNGSQFVIIDNDGSDAVEGTFNGLPQNEVFALDDVTYRISYTGGDGNDVVLTVGASLEKPNTGAANILTNPFVPLSVTVLSLGLIWTAAKVKKSKI